LFHGTGMQLYGHGFESIRRHRRATLLDEPFSWRICGSGSTGQLRGNGAGLPTIFECQKSTINFEELAWSCPEND